MDAKKLTDEEKKQIIESWRNKITAAYERSLEEEEPQSYQYERVWC